MEFNVNCVLVRKANSFLMRNPIGPGLKIQRFQFGFQMDLR